jgi:DNA helicase-2/ATP-dependent DNA helicase PcrA
LTHPEASGGEIATPARHPLLAGLTREQARAVTHGAGPLLLLAGPGAGKTRTLTHRIAWLLATGIADPWEILAVTFSVRTAGELRLRLCDLLGEQQARGVTAATFHSVCARLLREHAHLFGRTRDYTIYDQQDVRRVIGALLSEHDRGQIQHALAAYGQPAAGEVLAEISLAKNRLQTPDSYTRAAAHPSAELVAAVWRESELELERCNAMDFDDLLAFAVRLLAEHPHRLASLRARWRHVLVDEFQDTNHAQATLIDLLAGPDGNLVVVADDDQLIYRWRGADPEHVLGFRERYPGHQRIVLGRNFRSRAEILSAAARCVEHNQRRAPKALIAMRGAGGQVQVTAFADEHQEARWIALEIAAAITAGVPGIEILALARTGYATSPLQRALAEAGVPHRVLGSLGLYERAEVRDALAYLTLLANPADAQAFRRASSAPRRGIGTATASLVVTVAREQHRGDLITASAAARRLPGIRSQATHERLARFGESLQHVRAELAAGRSLAHIVAATLMLDGGLVAQHQHRRDSARQPEQRRDAERVLEDLRSLCRAAQSYQEQHQNHRTLTGFLEHAAGLHAQELAAGEQDQRVTVSTIHRAKGTEATLVVLLGCEEELLPSWRSLRSPDGERLAEERRLFYVAATRAKDRLLITHAHTRGGRLTGGPSRFLAEAGLHQQRPKALAA